MLNQTILNAVFATMLLVGFAKAQDHEIRQAQTTAAQTNDTSFVDFTYVFIAMESEQSSTAASAEPRKETLMAEQGGARRAPAQATSTESQ